MVLRNNTGHVHYRKSMAETGPLYLPMLTIMAFIMILGGALLALIYLVSTRTPNRFLRAAAPVAIMLLGIIWLKDTDTGNIIVASVLFVAPMAALIVPFLFPGFTGPKTGIKRIVACDLIISIVTSGFVFYYCTVRPVDGSLDLPAHASFQQPRVRVRDRGGSGARGSGVFYSEPGRGSG